MESMQIEKSNSLEININIYEAHGIRTAGRNPKKKQIRGRNTKSIL